MSPMDGAQDSWPMQHAQHGQPFRMPVDVMADYQRPVMDASPAEIHRIMQETILKHAVMQQQHRQLQGMQDPQSMLDEDGRMYL